MMRMKNKIGIKRLASESGPYKKWSLLQRREFIELRLDQEQDIKAMYEELSREIAREIARGNRSSFDIKRLKKLQSNINDRVSELNGQMTINFDNYIRKNIQVGSDYSKKITIDLITRAGIKKVTPGMVESSFQRMNAKAVEAMWNRTRYGLKLDDQIWNKSKSYRQGINNVLITGVAEGEDCVTVARALEKYIKKGKGSLSENYPNMLARMKRVPKNIEYEALRLARTEMTSAYGMANMKSAAMNPANRGVQFVLSDSHPEYDICDEICNADNYGMGPGAYPLDEAPDYPFHPNCICIQTQLNEYPDTFLERLLAWEQNPESDMEIEQWYQKNYAQFDL